MILDDWAEKQSNGEQKDNKTDLFANVKRPRDHVVREERCIQRTIEFSLDALQRPDGQVVIDLHIISIRFPFDKKFMIDHLVKQQEIMSNLTA